MYIYGVFEYDDPLSIVVWKQRITVPELITWSRDIERRYIERQLVVIYPKIVCDHGQQHDDGEVSVCKHVSVFLRTFVVIRAKKNQNINCDRTFW